jgi:hypothetical protein
MEGRQLQTFYFLFILFWVGGKMWKNYLPEFEKKIVNVVYIYGAQNRNTLKNPLKGRK